MNKYDQSLESLKWQAIQKARKNKTAVTIETIYIVLATLIGFALSKI